MYKETLKTKSGKYNYFVIKLGCIRMSIFYYKGFKEYKEKNLKIPLINLHIKFKYPVYDLKYTYRLELSKGWDK